MANRLYYEDQLKLKVGDKFFESDYGLNLEMEVVEAPIVHVSDSGDQVTFKARDLNTGQVVDYLTTKGLEHYGAKLYDGQAYFTLEEIQSYAKDNSPDDLG